MIPWFHESQTVLQKYLKLEGQLQQRVHFLRFLKGPENVFY